LALLPSSAMICTVTVSIDQQIFQIGVQIEATLMDMTLVPSALIFINWPLEICLRADLTIHPLSIVISAFWRVGISKSFDVGLTTITVGFSIGDSYELARWSSPSFSVMLLNTCPNLGSSPEAETLDRGAEDGIRAAAAPEVISFATNVLAGAVELQLTVNSSSPVSAEYRIFSDERPQDGQWLVLGSALEATSSLDASGKPFSFKKIYYIAARLTNKEGAVRNVVAGPLVFPPPASLKLKHELRLPPDSPGRALFQPPLFLPTRAGKPFAFYFQAQVEGGSFTDFSSLVALVSNRQLSPVDESANAFVDTAFVVSGTRVVWYQDPTPTLDASPRFLSADGSTFVVSLRNLAVTAVSWSRLTLLISTGS
jgi:hypothetical protein